MHDAFEHQQLRAAPQEDESLSLEIKTNKQPGERCTIAGFLASIVSPEVVAAPAISERCQVVTSCNECEYSFVRSSFKSMNGAPNGLQSVDIMISLYQNQCLNQANIQQP